MVQEKDRNMNFEERAKKHRGEICRNMEDRAEKGRQRIGTRKERTRKESE